MIFNDIHKLPVFKKPVITIGTFDGVHMGHSAILKEVVQHATGTGGESILITFEPHPRKLLFPNQILHILTPLEKKVQLVQQQGIEHVVVAHFTKAFSDLTAEEYIRDFLVKHFNPHSIVIGYDHRFGHDRKGDIHMLKKYADQYQYEVVEIPAQLIDEATVSSTKIRKALTEGHVQDAAHMLGHNYTVAGTVIKGRQLGKELGYPTANLQPSDADQLIPALGIYTVRVKHNGNTYGGMMSIGYNPTVTDEKRVNIEVNIFDFDEIIYDHTIEIEFIAWLRNEEKFVSLDALKAQLAKDKEASLSILK